MKLSEFDFELPEELIAQHPVEKRDTSRLMVVNRENGNIEHRHFYDIFYLIRLFSRNYLKDVIIDKRLAMKISRRYALRLMIDLAQNKRTGIYHKDVAKRQEISIKYLRQVFTPLIRAGLNGVRNCLCIFINISCKRISTLGTSAQHQQSCTN